MQAIVTDECIACERCVEICPAVFEMGDEYARVTASPVPPAEEAAVREAADECPTAAIEIS